MTETQSDRHPIGLIVDDDLKRSRLTVFFRLLLAIPQLIVLYLWGIVTCFAVVIAWFAALFTGRVPAGLHEFIARYLRMSTHVNAYILLLADPWPPFGGETGSYPVDVRIDPAAPQSRLTVFFRTLLAIPAFVLTYVFGIVNRLIAIFGWFYCLALGRMSQGMRDLSAWLLQYEVQTLAYVLLLTGTYPTLSGGPKV
ncbi:MAG TPA: DUF4389 domain-containing protein [Gaiellaceae bacterium]|jgi:hypothetical protein|nr:DUF4389 domain-containing protein [Gaiellaceae bacterium]